MAAADPTAWRRSRLGDRRSVLGALAVGGVFALFVLVIPYLEANVEARGGFDSAGRFIIDDYAAIELAEGWQVESQSELFTTVTDGTHQLILIASAPQDVTPEEALLVSWDGFSQDTANTVEPIQSLPTETGAEGATYRALLASDSGGSGAAFYAVADAGRIVQPSAVGPGDLSDGFYEVVDAMVGTILITAEPRIDG